MTPTRTAACEFARKPGRPNRRDKAAATCREELREPAITSGFLSQDHLESTSRASHARFIFSGSY
jgi:hypothetical protein